MEIGRQAWTIGRMHSLVTAFERLVLGRPRLTLSVILGVCAMFALFATRFTLDASADSLLLQGDPDLRYYRMVRARYGSDDYLVVTYTVTGDLLADPVLEDLRNLRDRLRGIPGIEHVTSLLDVPLVESPPVTLQELRESVPTLLSPRTDRILARRELTGSALYSQLIMSLDGRTTALLATLQQDPEYRALVDTRDRLYLQASSGPLSAQQRRELHRLKAAIKDRREIQVAAQRETIRQVREVLDGYRDRAVLRLGGLPMIVADMLDFILRDVMVFGVAILVFLVGLLALIFRRPRWIVLPLLTCLASAVLMTGLLGLARIPVTVVSANFVALLLIFCLSLTVHLIVRYQELHKLHPEAGQRELVARTLRDKWLPCAYTSATTMVAFTSLLVSGIQPVIDFGWLMVAGMVVLLLLSFTLFPAGLMLVHAGKPQPLRRTTERITLFFAKLTSRFPVATLVVYGLVAVIAVAGLSRLEVESRFIDNFKDTTEIYQGLVTIDRELGGTTPLDVVLDADSAFFDRQQVVAGDEFYDEFDDELDAEADEQGNDLGASSYWYNSYQLGRVADVHRYLESLSETGKVLSIATTVQTLTIVNGGRPPDTFFLSLLYRNLPESVRQSLFDPYLSADGNQVRLSVRVRESDPDLRRQQLLDRIREHLTGEMGFSPEQVHLSGMLVLYNNVLQSLYRSQILTIGFVFLSILAMFFALFRSLKLALIALIPNVLAAGAVLGMMGLAGIPLDIMTITIAAIAVGIGVDDSIHYVYRFRAEFARHHNYAQALHDSHASIGRAMYYTSVIVAVGFSILALSNFMPTVYFGLLTCLAMVFALIANLTLLPLLLMRFQALGPETGSAA